MSKIKKILVLNPYIPTLGGGEKHMGYMCEFLEETYSNLEIHILVHDYNNIDIYNEKYVTIEDLNKRFGLNLKKTKILRYKLIKSDKYTDKLKNKIGIEELTKKYDIFINFMFLSKHIGKANKNIYSCMFPPKPFTKEMENGSIIERIIAKFLDYRFYKSYNIVLTNSCFTDYWLKIYWRKIENNKVLYPPVFTEKDLYNRYDNSNKKNIILSVGRFFVGTHNKKQFELVKFYLNNKGRLKNYELHLVGALSNHPKDIEYANKIKESTVNENIFLHLNASFEELTNLYRSAKIFWHGTGFQENENENPEKMEHFGITTVEAMSYGAVPIVINRGGQIEIVNDNEVGFLWNTEKECVDLTCKLINDESLRQKMAEKARDRAKDFSVEKFNSALKEIFNEI